MKRFFRFVATQKIHLYTYMNIYLYLWIYLLDITPFNGNGGGGVVNGVVGADCFFSIGSDVVSSIGLLLFDVDFIGSAR